MDLIEHAKKEFEILGWPGDCEMQQAICEDVLALLETFGKQGHSGFSASYALTLFKKLANFEPIGPLTGGDSEWHEYEPNHFQNKRCSEVFKDPDGRVYWINGRVFETPDGCRYTNKDSAVEISFPWEKTEPEIVYVDE